MDRRAALAAAQEVARALDLRWARVEFDVADGRVHRIDKIVEHVDERDLEEHVELQEGK